MQMVQLWVNLRARDKGAPPRYQTLRKAQIPVVSLPDDAGTLRVIAGQFGDQQGPAKTFSPINLWDLDMQEGRSAELPLTDGHTTALLILEGEIEAGDQQRADEGALAIYSRHGNGIALKTNKDSKVLVLSGEPFAEPIVGHGPFVMNSRAEIQQAFEDYQLGRMGAI